MVDPQMCGIAGVGSLQVFLPDRGVHECIDFHAKSPLATRPDQWEHLIVGETRDGFGRFSSLCPTMTFDGDELEIVVGAPGGTQIAMGVTQVLLNCIEFDMPILDAISAPRLSGTSDAIDVSNRIPWSVTDVLEAESYEVIRSPRSHDFAWVHGIRFVDEGPTGAADPAADGSVQAV